jgi:Rho guanine nucleotide exchange factor 10
MITKSKSRRLLLLNDLLVCVSVAPKSSDDFGSSERLSLKWTFPVTDVDVSYTQLLTLLSNKQKTSFCVKFCYKVPYSFIICSIP